MSHNRDRPGAFRAHLRPYISQRALQAVGALLLVLTLVGAVLAIVVGPAGAATQITTAIVPQQPFSTGPFDSGQQVDIDVPAGYLTPNSAANIFECADPDGTVANLPTTITECDGLTNYSGGSITTDANGAIPSLTNATEDLTSSGELYTIYALPDRVSLGETSTHGATCGLGAANECVLYIGNGGGTDTGLSAPHVFSQPFQVHTDSTDSGTINPGDGSAAVAAAVSPTLSTVTPATQSVVADGADPATVTVTLLDTNSAPVTGKTVTLTPGSGSSTVTDASAGSNVTNGNGVATFTVTDSTAESVTYTAADSTDSITLTHTVQVTFTPQTINNAASTVTADPTSVAQSGTSTITVTVRDHGANPAPIPNQTITLAPNGGSSVITPASSGSDVTNASGEATFDVTDAVNESVIYTATDTTSSTVLTSTASVLFGPPLSVSASKSTVTAPSLATVGVDTTVTVTLLAGDGKTPESGKSVSLALASASGNATAMGTSPQVTNSAGQASFSITDPTAESVTITATDTSDSLVLQQQPVVAFQVQQAPTLSPSLSTAIVTGSPAPADGLSDAIVNVTAENTLDQPMTGLTVTVTGASSTTVDIDPLLEGSGSTPGVTNSQGVVQVAVRDTKAETIVLTVTINGVALTQQPTVSFEAGAPDANVSTVAAAPSQVAADGTTPSTITVTLSDYFGNPIAGRTISLAAGAGSSVITPTQSTSGVAPGTTDANGVAEFKVTDATTEVVTYTATDSTDALPLNQLVAVTFGTPPPVVPTMADSTVTASSTSVAGDGKTAAVITVELRDANGDPVTGKSVTLTASGSTAQVTATTAAAETRAAIARSHVIVAKADPHAATTTATSTSDSNGNAIFEVTDTTPETVTLTADDTTDSMTGWTVAVTFTAASATTTTTTTTTGTGSTTTTTTPASASSSSDGSTGLGSTGSGSTDSGSTGGVSTDASTSSTPALAFTGAPEALPWLGGLGALLLLIGTFGRRLLSAARKSE